MAEIPTTTWDVAETLYCKSWEKLPTSTGVGRISEMYLVCVYLLTYGGTTNCETYYPWVMAGIQEIKLKSQRCSLGLTLVSSVWRYSPCWDYPVGISHEIKLGHSQGSNNANVW